MLKYHEENSSLMQPAQIQAHPTLPSYVKMSTRLQLKDHPIYPGLNSPNPMGGVEGEFVKYISGPLTSTNTSILVYWQVSPISHSIRSILSQIILPTGHQVRIPYTLRYCHGLSSHSSVFCPLQTCLFVGWGD